MKAFRIVEPGRTDVVDVPEPLPGPGEVRLRVAYVGLCGTDLNTFRGRNPLVSYPRIPGHELSGIVERCGEGVPPALSPGTHVFVVPYEPCGRCTACRQGRMNTCRDNKTLGVQKDGGGTELLVVPAHRLLTHPSLSLGAMALVEPLTVGYHAAERARVSPGDTVAVFGCGGVGVGAIAAAARRGGRVIAIDVDDRKLALARKAGAREGVNSTARDVHEALLSLTDGDGPLVTIDAVGAPSTVRSAVEEVAFAGRVVLLGYTPEEVPLRTKLFVQKELDVLGTRNATPPDFLPVAAMLAEGALLRDSLVSRVVSLADAGQALAEWSADPASVSKIQIDVGGRSHPLPPSAA
jgi:threonine dehydrogenase-like Zn-dependent dehydrogenase